MTDDDEVASSRVVRPMAARLREFACQLGRKTMEMEVVKEALEKVRPRRPMGLAQTQPTDGCR